ncbi:MAG TPA: hypothetical protein DD379_23310, partial [Cyanobacteria bacterium UBA11162]|nr:hypothetical protein [Cyanobacteria bacterium UBA11162]
FRCWLLVVGCWLLVVGFYITSLNCCYNSISPISTFFHLISASLNFPTPHSPLLIQNLQPSDCSGFSGNR